MSNRNPKVVNILKEYYKDRKSVKSNGSVMHSMFEKMILKVAIKNEVSTSEVRNIVKSVFECTNILLKDSISKKDTEDFKKEDLISVRWIGFGSFQISKWRVYNYFRRRDKDVTTR